MAVAAWSISRYYTTAVQKSATRPGFDPYLCIQNPGSTYAKVQITYMKADNTSATDDITVPKSSRTGTAPKSMYQRPRITALPRVAGNITI